MAEGFGNKQGSVPAGLELTLGSLTRAASASPRSVIHKFQWTNANVVALGAATTGNITVCTLPAKTVVKRAYIVITGQGAGATTLTVSLGRVSTAYTDYIVASNAKAAANTVYGDATAEQGAGITLAGDLPSVTGTTAVIAQFISTGANLSAVTGSTGDIYIETITLP